MRHGLIALVFIVGITRSLLATTILPADVGELSHDAVAIVVGRVAAVDARWTAERRGIETLVTLDVETYLKGALGESVQFVTCRGRAGPLSEHRRGRASFREGRARASWSSSAHTDRAFRSCSVSTRASSA